MQQFLPSPSGFSRRRQLAVITSLLAAVFCCSGCSRPTEAIAWLKVEDDPAPMWLRYPGFHSPPDYEQYRKMQAALIESPDVLRRALNDLTLAQVKLIQSKADPEQWLRDSLQVKAPIESDVLQIALKADSNTDAVKIVNAVVDSYLKNVVDQERQSLAQTFDRFDNEVKTLTAEIAKKQEQLAGLSAQTNSDSKESLEDSAATSDRKSDDSATLRDEIKIKQAMLRDLEAKRERLQLLMKLPNRVSLLRYAGQ